MRAARTRRESSLGVCASSGAVRLLVVVTVVRFFWGVAYFPGRARFRAAVHCAFSWLGRAFSSMGTSLWFRCCSQFWSGRALVNAALFLGYPTRLQVVVVVVVVVVVA